MSSIGLIFRADRALDALPEDWIPIPLGTRELVTAVVARHVPEDVSDLALIFRIEDKDESEDPRTISVSGIWGDKELRVIKEICNALDARFYDAEEAEFLLL